MNILYTKWRPKKFSDVIGQDHIISYFKNSLILNKIHHSYLFLGNKGTGKTSISRLLVKSLNCINIKKIIKNDNDFPCNECENCLLINKNKFSDFIEINSSLKSSIEDIKDLLNNIYYLPIKSKYKIYLMDEIHMLSKQGFSSLLKFLEEPPDHVKFILATNETKKIPDTILSRCVILNLYNISENDIFKRLIYILKKEKIKFGDSSIKIISEFSKGIIRDSINIIEKCSLIGKNIINKNIVNKCLGICDVNNLIILIENIILNKINNFIHNLNKINEFILNYNNVFILIINLLHSIFMLNLNKKYIIDIHLLKYNNSLVNLSKNQYIKKIYILYNNILYKKKYYIYYENDKSWFNMLLIDSFYKINNNFID